MVDVPASSCSIAWRCVVSTGWAADDPQLLMAVASLLTSTRLMHPSELKSAQESKAGSPSQLPFAIANAPTSERLTAPSPFRSKRPTPVVLPVMLGQMSIPPMIFVRYWIAT